MQKSRSDLHSIALIGQWTGHTAIPVPQGQWYLGPNGTPVIVNSNGTVTEIRNVGGQTQLATYADSELARLSRLNSNSIGDSGISPAPTQRITAGESTSVDSGISAQQFGALLAGQAAQISGADSAQQLATKYINKRSKYLKKIISTMLLFIASAGTYTYALDMCTSSRSRIEKIICNSNSTKNLDSRLQKIYDALIDLENKSDAEALRKSQRLWLAEKRDLCDSTSCLENRYKERISGLENQLLNRYLDSSKSSIIFKSITEIGNINNIISKISNPSIQKKNKSYGGSIAKDILPVVVTNNEGRSLIILQSLLFNGLAVRYWNPEDNIEWIPAISKTDQSTEFLVSSLKNLQTAIKVKTSERSYHSYFSKSEDCRFSAEINNIRYTSCQESQPIAIGSGDFLDFRVSIIHEGVNCLKSYGRSMYYYRRKDESETIRMTPLMLLKTPVTSMYGGKYCEHLSSASVLNDVAYRQNVIEPSYPYWVSHLTDGSILMFANAPAPHSNLLYFYKLFDLDFLSFEDKRMKLAWVQTNWLIKNGYLEGMNDLVDIRLKKIDQFFLETLRSK